MGRGRSRERSEEASVGDVDPHGSRDGGEKWLCSGYILKVEPKGVCLQIRRGV